MHVAILCEYETINGGENSILAMIERLPSIDVTFFAPPTGRLAERLRQKGIKHVPLSLFDGGTRLPIDAAITRLREVLDALDPDLLHANSLSMGRLTGALVPSISPPCTAHLRDILRLNRSTIANLNCNARLFAVSKATKKHHVEQGLDPDRTFVLYNGIDTKKFCGRERTGYLHRELSLPATAQLVATIGQISLRKGLDVLLDAAIINVDILPDLHYLIVGERYSSKSESVELEQRLHQKVMDAGLESRVHWLGYRNDLPRLLNELDALVHTSLQEPLGRVLLEAAACGIAIVASAVGGTAEILQDDVSGLLVPPGDANKTATGIRKLLANEDRRLWMGNFAARDVSTKFDLPQRARELAQHWRQVIASSNSAGHTQ